MATCRISVGCLGLALVTELLTDGRGREKWLGTDSVVEVDICDSRDEDVVETEGRWPLPPVIALVRELVRRLIGGVVGFVLLACSGMARNGAGEVKLLRKRLLSWPRLESCDLEVLGLRYSAGPDMLSREWTLGTDMLVLGGSKSSSSESEESESTLVALGSKSAKLCSVFCVALDVLVCLLDTLAAQSVGGDIKLEDATEARGFSAIGPQSSSGTYAGMWRRETDEYEGDRCRLVLADDAAEAVDALRPRSPRDGLLSLSSKTPAPFASAMAAAISWVMVSLMDVCS